MLKVTPGTIRQHKEDADEEVEDGEAGENNVENKDEVQIVVEIHHVMQMIIEILNLRVHNMEDQMKRFFIEGDDNGDGVLSFEEFDALLKRIAPTFSDRRILRMFREALTSGDDDGFAIEKSTFAEVCKNHGLVRLIDSQALDEIHDKEQIRAKLHREKLERIKAERLGNIRENTIEESEEDDE